MPFGLAVTTVIVTLITGIAMATGAIWLVSAIASVWILIVAFRRYCRMSHRVIEPGWLIGAVLFVYYHVRVIALVVAPDSTPRHDIGAEAYQLSTLNDVSILATVAIAAVTTGFATTFRYRPVVQGSLNRDERVITGCFVVSVVAIIATITKARLGFVHYGGLSVIERSTSGINQILTLAETAGWLAYFAFVFIDRPRAMWKRSARFVAIGLQLVTAITAGGGGPLFLWALPFLIRWDRAATGRVITGARAALAIMLAISGIGMMLFVKEVSRQYENEYGIPTSISGIASNLDLLPGATTAALNAPWFWEASSRFMGADSLALIITEIRSGRQPFLYGKTLALTPISFIPRAVWPDKPDIALGMYYTDRWWRSAAQVQEAGEGTQGTAFCLPGEFYMNFGVVGILIGMFIVGAISGRIYTRFATPGATIGELVLLTSIFDPLIRWEFSFAAWTAGIVQATLIFFCFWMTIRALGLGSALTNVHGLRGCDVVFRQRAVWGRRTL